MGPFERNLFGRTDVRTYECKSIVPPKFLGRSNKLVQGKTDMGLKRTRSIRKIIMNQQDKKKISVLRDLFKFGEEKIHAAESVKCLKKSHAEHQFAFHSAHLLLHTNLLNKK